MKTIRYVGVLLGVLAGPLLQSAGARSFRVSMIPNGSVLSCANCHINPAGSGTRTPFGNAVFAITGSSSSSFWSPTLAALDSDGDGLTNGQELGDPQGTGVPTAGAVVSNPGNRPPVIGSTPPATGTRGVAYHYQASATDAEGNSIVFAKQSGPAWLAVTSAGLVSGAPTASEGGSVEVVIQIRDTGTSSKGYSRQTNTQSFNLTINSSFAGWQALYFDLPAESALAEALADPDGDGIPNLAEYAWGLDPKSQDSVSIVWPSFDAEGHFQLSMKIRDDDPKLAARLLVSDTALFTAPETILGVLAPTVPPQAGFPTLIFTDTLSRDLTGARFGKVQFELLP